jgi:IS605 OrfB family transposase
MQLTAKVKLQVSPEQANALTRTIRRANACCDWLSERAWHTHTFSQFNLHQITYYDARAAFPDLGSCVVVRCLSKVAQAYKLDQHTKRTFKPGGAIEYDKNLLSWYVDKRVVSIWTVDGRMKLPFVAGGRQLELLQGKIGQADLSFVNGEFYMSAPCFVEEPVAQDVHDVLGCDLGIVNSLTDSDGETHSGEKIETTRRTYSHRRRNLQRKGTKATKRKLKQISGKQSRFQRNTNHLISKRVVAKAQDTVRAIALEDLTGIRVRGQQFRRQQRAQHANWSFFDLRAKITYEANRAGVPVILVDRKYTSKLCPHCGCIDKANRKSQSEFLCVSCGYAAPADHSAARNIRVRALVNVPMVAIHAGSCVIQSQAACFSGGS